VRNLITRHAELTGSPRAKWILENWSEIAARFTKVFPHEFKRVLGVSRSQAAYVPSMIANQAEVLAQVQHG
jgi:glutamate synthase domain-containing protein 3